MNKLNGHNAGIGTSKAVKPQRKSAIGKAAPPLAGKEPSSPFPATDAGQLPLRAAKGDDDLMSKEPSAPERG